ncbi:hypothetical protein BLOT_009221 [Blomia tropicalis]|nr:hypothetical protein BLOT_009221 [Blomia tropicalis]
MNEIFGPRLYFKHFLLFDQLISRIEHHSQCLLANQMAIWPTEPMLQLYLVADVRKPFFLQIKRHLIEN